MLLEDNLMQTPALRTEFPKENSKSRDIATPAYSQAALKILPLGWSKILP